MLSRLRTAYPESRTITDLIADRLVAGSPAAIKKTLQRLEAQQLIVSSVTEGSRSKLYKANLARGEGWSVSPMSKEVSDGAVFGTGQQDGDMTGCPPLLDGAVEIELTEEEQGQI